MKINLSITLDEAQLRSVRAAQGRGGKATRSDVRVFANRAIRAALDAAPAAKPKRVRVAKVAPAPLEWNAICKNCGETRERHGRLFLTCSKPGKAIGGRGRSSFVDSGLRKESLWTFTDA